MHNNILPKYFLFVDCYDKKKLDHPIVNLGIIYRNYSKYQSIEEALKIRSYCKKRKFKFYISNNLNFAIKLKADGIYIPSFNNKLIINKFNLKKEFKIIGSAHNQIEIKRKKIQKCEAIFLSPLFKTNKKRNELGICKFNLLTLGNKNNFIALGGINNSNKKCLKMLNIAGMAGIGYFKKKPAQKLGRYL